MELRRLAKHHPSLLIGQQLHEVVVATVPAVDALRSFTAKCALTLFQVGHAVTGRAGQVMGPVAAA